jgi:two-component system OmpR family response regulator
MPIETILLVDDDPSIRQVATLTLERVGGWAVRVAGSGAQALELARDEPPDLVLIDVMMPGMDGPETLARLRELPGFAAVPVVFMTARVQTHEIEEYRALGVVGVVSKPFDPLTLPQQLLEFVPS